MKKALIVIDVQKYFLIKETKPIIKGIRDFLKQNSSEYLVIYFTIFKNDKNSPLWQISEWRDCTSSPQTDVCDEIKEFTNNKNLFYKNILSAGKVPGIINDIKKKNIEEVDLLGFDTDCCVLATAYDLFDQGIKPVVIENLTWSTSKDRLHSSAIKMIRRNIGFVSSGK